MGAACCGEKEKQESLLNSGGDSAEQNGNSLTLNDETNSEPYAAGRANGSKPRQSVVSRLSVVSGVNHATSLAVGSVDFSAHGSDASAQRTAYWSDGLDHETDEVILYINVSNIGDDPMNGGNDGVGMVAYLELKREYGFNRIGSPFDRTEAVQCEPLTAEMFNEVMRLYMETNERLKLVVSEAMNADVSVEKSDPIEFLRLARHDQNRFLDEDLGEYMFRVRTPASAIDGSSGGGSSDGSLMDAGGSISGDEHEQGKQTLLFYNAEMEAFNLCMFSQRYTEAQH